MKVKLLDDSTPFYDDTDLASTLVKHIVKGQELDIGKTVKENGMTWVSACLPDGTCGFILGSTKIFTIMTQTLLQAHVDVREQPRALSPIRVQYHKGQQFEVLGVIESEGSKWVELRDATGVHGYIEGATKIQTGTQKPPGNYERDLKVGALWCIGGIIVTAVTYSNATASPSGGHYIIAWGAILFGGIQFLKGLFGLASQDNKSDKPK